MRVLVVTTVHTPLDARIHHRQIRAMIDAGWQVTFAAPFRDAEVNRADIIEGVTTIDLPRARGRRRLRALVAARRIMRALAPHHDLVLVHDPELLLAAGPRTVPTVLDVHEDLAASLPDRPWVPDLLRPVAAAAARALERAAERQHSLILAEEQYGSRFRRDHPLVRNLPWAPPEEVARTAVRDAVIYVGRISVGRGARELIALGQALGPDGPTVELIGEADDAVLDEVRNAHRAGIVQWHGFLPNQEATARMAGARAGLSLLHDLPNYQVSLPTKVVEYLAAGVPVISTPLPQARSLLTASQGGIEVPFGDVEAVAEAVRQLADPQRRHALGAAGRSYVVPALTWDREAERFLDALRAVARR